MPMMEIKTIDMFAIRVTRYVCSFDVVISTKVHGDIDDVRGGSQNGNKKAMRQNSQIHWFSHYVHPETGLRGDV